MDKETMRQIRKEIKGNINLCTEMCQVSLTDCGQKTKKGLTKWMNKRATFVLDKAIRSDILKYVCMALMKNGGYLQVQQLVYILEDLGYSSVDTSYKFITYVEKMNERYQLPISFSYGHRYMKLDFIDIEEEKDKQK